MDQRQVGTERLVRTLNRRQALRFVAQGAGVGVLGALLSACAGGTASVPAAPAPTAASTIASQPAPTSAPAQTSAVSAAWDQLVAAAQKEGKVVVSGPPVPDARTKLPEAFKQRFNIEMEYLAGNSSQLASRIESERAAEPYTIDCRLGCPDTGYGTV